MLSQKFVTSFSASLQATLLVFALSLWTLPSAWAETLSSVSLQLVCEGAAQSAQQLSSEPRPALPAELSAGVVDRAVMLSDFLDLEDSVLSRLAEQKLQTLLRHLASLNLSPETVGELLADELALSPELSRLSSLIEEMRGLQMLIEPGQEFPHPLKKIADEISYLLWAFSAPASGRAHTDFLMAFNHARKLLYDLQSMDYLKAEIDRVPAGPQPSLFLAPELDSPRADLWQGDDSRQAMVEIHHYLVLQAAAVHALAHAEVGPSDQVWHQVYRHLHALEQETKAVIDEMLAQDRPPKIKEKIASVKQALREYTQKVAVHAVSALEALKPSRP